MDVTDRVEARDRLLGRLREDGAVGPLSAQGGLRLHGAYRGPADADQDEPRVGDRSVGPELDRGGGAGECEVTVPPSHLDERRGGALRLPRDANLDEDLVGLDR